MGLISLVLSLLLMSVAIEAKTLFFEARDNKLCPDGQERCPDGTTCCQLPDGRYGCCQYPDAVCCPDHEHCCPSGYTCDVPDKKCVKNDGESIEWTKKLEVVPLRKDSNNVICPDQQSYCDDGQTCCQLVSGQWGCCPYPVAVCCSDHAHCCPNGYTCDVAAGKCVTQNGESMPWSHKTNALQISSLKSNDVTCPDGSTCADGQTCCELPDGHYGCCPYPQAECCAGTIYCCPNGYTCDVPHGQCLKGNGESISWSPKMKTIQNKQLKSDDVPCPGGGHCDDGQTCCELPSGKYGCCPYPQAVCCTGTEYCCPNGYTCDVPHGQCLKGNGESISWSPKMKAIQDKQLNSNDVPCPDGSHCGDGETCCALPGGGYGCCPYPQAVCCSGTNYCCPNGYTCDVPHGQCVKGNGESISWSPKMKAIQIKQLKSNDVTCPDGSTCADGQTCCELPDGSYGCCPYPQAVCCTGTEYCCPNGYTCDVPHGQCLKGNGESISWSPKMKTIQNKQLKSNYVVCPDGGLCYDWERCCPLPWGGYGCCPHSQWVCCIGTTYCVAPGHSCDVSSRTYYSESISWSPKMKAIQIKRQKSNDVTCPDGSTCADGQTCCELPDGRYGCCPYPQAVCCTGTEYCCPNGYTCDVPHGQCLKGNGESILWSPKMKAIQNKQLEIRGKTEEQRVSIVCPDGSSCSAEETCCLISPSQYGCCPLPQATCCPDYHHCCPNGYTCDMLKQTCIKGNGVEIPWTRKSPSKSRPVENSACADQKSGCRDDYTCCGHSGTEVHGCCPYENAVCCSNGAHCCPENTVCDLKTNMCQSTVNSMAISWHRLEKLTGAHAGLGSVKTDEKCPDRKSECPSETTCCQMQSGLYGCCPFKDALCCEDKLHCCPVGFKCDAEHSRCVVEKSGVALPWEMFGRKPAKITP